MQINPPRERRHFWSTVIILMSTMIFCAAVSVFFLLPQSLRLDEAQSLWESGRSPSALLMIVAKDVHVPLFHILLHMWRVAFGSSVAAARSLSLVFYILSIPAIYILGRLAYSRSTGLYASVLFGLSPFMNWYGNEIRMYALFTLLIILNQFFFLRIIKQGSARIWIGYGTTAMLGIYTHYLFFLSLAAQAVFYFLHRSLFPPRSLARFSIVAAVLVFSFAPWVWYVYALKEAGMQLPLLMPPTTVDLFNTFSQFVFGFQDDTLNTIFVSLWPITVILVFLALRRGARFRFETEYFLYTIICSFAALFIGSFVLTPVFVSRYLIFTVPSLYLVLAHFFDAYPPRLAQAARWSVAIVMVAGLVIQIQSPATPVKENYRQVVTYINEHAGPQDTIILSTPFTIYPIEYYYHSPATLATLPIWNRYDTGPIPAFSPAQLPAQVATLTDGYQKAWLVLSYDQGYEQTIKSYFDQHYRRIGTEHFSRDLDLYVYQLRYDTPLARQ
ncbi:glycosyltransferase family 39 protein [Candidatus Kaiserbacteria bacterium]|nr:glycosyltransferase family 39 protein [Candidatus Kaiserbacteria bacterium]